MEDQNRHKKDRKIILIVHQFESLLNYLIGRLIKSHLIKKKNK